MERKHFSQKKALPNKEKPLKNKGIPAFCAVDFRFRNIEMDRTSQKQVPEQGTCFFLQLLAKVPFLL